MNWPATGRSSVVHLGEIRKTNCFSNPLSSRTQATKYEFYMWLYSYPLGDTEQRLRRRWFSQQRLIQTMVRFY